MADTADSVRFASANVALPARSTTGAFTFNVTFASDASLAMLDANYAVSATLLGSTAALTSVTLRGVSGRSTTGVAVLLNNTAAIAAGSLYVSVLAFPAA